MTGSRMYQRGFIQVPTTGELFGCLAVIGVVFICVGIAVAIFAPMVWAWLKPIMQGWLA